jgi:hypothetical protein
MIWHKKDVGSLIAHIPPDGKPCRTQASLSLAAKRTLSTAEAST